MKSIRFWYFCRFQNQKIRETNCYSVCILAFHNVKIECVAAAFVSISQYFHWQLNWFIFFLAVIVVEETTRSRFGVSQPQCHFDLCTVFSPFFLLFVSVFLYPSCWFHFSCFWYRFFLCCFLYAIYVWHEIPLQRVQCIHVLIFDCEVFIKWLVSREIDTFEIKSLARGFFSASDVHGKWLVLLHCCCYF